MILKKKKVYFWGIVLFAVTIVAFIVRWKGIEYITGDLYACVIPWSEAMKTGQGLSILSTYDGDYNMPYITILWLLNYLPGRTIIKVKMVSVLFDYFGAMAAGLITVHFAEKEKKILWFTAAYTAILFYPSVVLNGAYWGQCDSLYVAFLLYMILALLKRRYKMAMIFWGFALAFKLQAVLILPILLIFWWKERKFSCTAFSLVPIMMEVLCIPAILGGHSILVPFLVYKRQLGRYPNMYVYYPNVWALFKDAPYYIFSSVAILFVLVGLGIFALAVIRKQEKIREKQWIEYVVWSIFFIMCFLPCMHERYGMLVEVLTVIYAFLERRTWWNVVIIGIGSYITYLQTAFGYSFLPDQWIAVFYLLSFGLFSWYMIKDWHEEEGKEVCGKHWKKGGKGVLSIENRMMDMINRHVLLIAAVTFTILAAMIRKPMIEYMSPDYLSNLIEIEGNYHTPLYMLVMFVLSGISNYIFEGKTLFFLVKMLCLASDVFAAVMAVLCLFDFKVRRSAGKLVEGNKKALECDLELQAVILYGVMLFFPGELLNSSLWGHLDSISIGLLMGAYLLHVRERKIMAGALAGVACGLLTYYVVWLMATGLIVKGLWEQREEKNNKRGRGSHFLNSFIIVFLLCGLSGIFCEYTIGESVCKFLLSWRNTGDWALYPILVLVLIACFCDQNWIPVWLLMEMAVVLDWGEFLYNQPILPGIVYALLYLLAGIWGALLIWKNGNIGKTGSGC